MSLFKTRDWWSVPFESDSAEECDSGHLLIGNITNANPQINNIIVGGYSGALKIYAPQSFENEEEEKETYGYRADHLLLEVALGIPILQLSMGKFVSGNSNLHLCVLHQDHIVIYSVSFISGQTGHGSQAKLSKAYQHNFQRKAYSITTGNFGSVKGRDFIAVQSLDGCISFYEQESLGFVCFLPGFLLPGPMVYLTKSDTLVTQAADWTLQSYTYQTLSVLVQEGAKPTNLKFGGKRIQPEWTQILSEWAIEIEVLVEPGNVSSILILTTRAFMCYKDSGVLKFIKKLEFNPMCFTAYLMCGNNAIHICVGSNTRNLLLYKESELKWASQLPFNPVAIKRSDFKGIEGALVLLGEEGQLQVCYMGTDPSLFVAPPHETREINYELTDKEMSRLNKIIRNSTKDIGTIMNMSNRDRDLVVTASVGNQLEAWVGTTKVNDPDGIPSVPVVIRLTTHSPLKAVRVNVHVQKPVSVTQTPSS
ncbi:Protein PTHB1 [Armadillidium vulgare]|nr:Protein PTHB1 [Armadillidium vulgare]